MKTVLENVRIINNADGEAMGMIRRDPVTKKANVYLLTDASVDQVGALIEQKKDVEDVA